jgi:hypothetical protein
LFIHAIVCVVRAPRELLCPGAHNAVKTALCKSSKYEDNEITFNGTTVGFSINISCRWTNGHSFETAPLPSVFLGMFGINIFYLRYPALGTNGQLFPLTDNTDGAAVDQVQQQHLFISKLHRLTLG